MWLLEFVPDVVFHFILAIGFIGFIASKFFSMFLKGYSEQLQIISLILLVFGVFMEGAIFNQGSWESKVLKAENVILGLQVDSEKQNTIIAEKIKENELLRKERKYASQKVVTQVVSKYDGQCVLSNAFIRVHDSAAQDRIPNSTEESDGKASNVKPSEVLNTVIDNYETCYKWRDQVIGWQEWYNTKQELFNK